MQRRRVLGSGLWGAIAALAPRVGRAQEAPGWFGLSLKVDADGILSPVLRSVTLGEIKAGSPAAAGGLVAGDEIVEVEGVKVAGGKAADMKARMTKPVGGLLRLRLKRASGELYDAVLVAARRPA